MEQSIYTLVSGADWRIAERAGEYRGSAHDQHDGFLHFSTAAQLRATAAKHRRGEQDLFMVEVDPVRLGQALKWEPASGSSRPGLFPHLYAALPLSAVLAATRLTLAGDGLHVFPSEMP